MSAAVPFSLVVPLWNEGANVRQLVAAIAASGLPEQGMRELVLVNNGSADETGALVDACAATHPWIVPVHLAENHNYGGGVYEGCKRATCDVVCYIPGDLQVMPDDVQKVHRAFTEAAAPARQLVKGHRTVRHDPLQTRVVSRVYTALANGLLQLRVRDVNGLPKMFHRALLDLLPAERMKSFVFDSQLLALARSHGWRIEEVPVTFHGRREGVSSWSGKRVRVYFQVARQIWRLRGLRGAPGIPMERLR